jgi:hypothetical protein
MNNMIKIILKVFAVLILASCSTEDELVVFVSFVKPDNGAVIVETFDVEVNVEPINGIERIELYMNNISIGMANASPYVFTVNIEGYSAGLHTLKALAYSQTGKTFSGEIQINIAKPSLEKPIGLTATKGEFGAKIVLEWNPSPNTTSYEIYKLDNLTGKYSQIGTSIDKAYEDVNIEKTLTQYFYKVRAFNSETVFSDYSEVDFGYTSGKPYDLVRSFGQEGTAVDQFGFVALISIDNNDLLYLNDGTQNNIKIYSLEGSFQGLLKSNVDSQAPLFIGSKVVTSQGESLVIEESGQPSINIATGLNIVGQMAHDNDGNIYLAVNHNSIEGYNHHRIYKYDLSGAYITNWGSKGTGDGQLNEPWGVSISADNVIVTCQINRNAQFFNKAGQYLKSIDFTAFANITYGNFVRDNYLYVAAGSSILKTDLDGKVIEKIGEGILTNATSVVVANNGDIIVTEPYSRKIRVFRKS